MVLNRLDSSESELAVEFNFRYDLFGIHRSSVKLTVLMFSSVLRAELIITVRSCWKSIRNISI